MQTNKQQQPKAPGKSELISRLPGLQATLDGLYHVAAFLIATRHLLQERGWGASQQLGAGTVF